MINKKKKRKIIIAISITLIVLLVIVPLGISTYIYQSNFGGRFETISWMARNLDEFDGLESKKYTFESNNGQHLVGYKYYKKIDHVKGIVVISHGLGGGGHNSYMDVADYLATNGYIIFAYDATGNDESEGDAVEGIPQGLIDLDYAIRFIKDNDEFNSLPIMLLGHSWGAYSVGSVLNIHPDVKAVVMISGFNKSTDIIAEEGKRIMGIGINLLMPYVSMIEHVKFGTYSSYNCIDGFETSDAGVMIVHSYDDEMVSYEKQYKRFWNTYQNNPRFTFVPYENRGHNYIYYSDISKDYRNKLNNQFSEFVSSLDTELTAEIKTKYMNENLNKTILFDLDKDLMNRIVAFYDNYTK
ncbi:alpha/beta hydrolase [Lachnoclostridium phytofermentans]|uniref:Serine aminopeptidase S33 domain-containing protein n=1 Tax=Lachnoclostridium phytofermentans (strain ATCC 700394 / DSM 18823 / ISDg) TaxID=357809 RepID=A9KHS1_LACP7|nr:alpha/beta fold hydrolase [Lachnoclostridium phytofermentans]ABX42356.1 conserved hypothetical protein [Lachnoclostridium phytofermentans ISDg]